jgi:hypothetical protein
MARSFDYLIMGAGYAGRTLADEQKGVTFAGRLPCPRYNQDPMVAQAHFSFGTLPDL